MKMQEFGMESVNVCITTTIAKENLERITNVSPSVKLTSVAALFRGERHGDAAAKEKLDAILAKAEVAFGLRFPKNIIARAPKLKWMHVFLAGVDNFLDSQMLNSSVILTKTAGIQSAAMSEFIIGRMLMFAKHAPTYFQSKQKKQWERLDSSILRSKTLGIVGLGNVGQELARLAKAFGIRVIATRRSAKQVGRARNVDVMLPPNQLHQLLADSDFVALTLPITPETNKLIGEEELHAMKSTAYLINISRGQIVDEEALIQALDKHWIAGAALDVFTSEPLPINNKLWELPNVIFSPHVAASMEDYPVLATELFCENLRRYLNGKKLLNVVSKGKKY